MRKIRKGRCRETSKAQALKLIVVDSRLLRNLTKTRVVQTGVNVNNCRVRCCAGTAVYTASQAKTVDRCRRPDLVTGTAAHVYIHSSHGAVAPTALFRFFPTDIRT
jgi:hypothetical protein